LARITKLENSCFPFLAKGQTLPDLILRSKDIRITDVKHYFPWTLWTAWVEQIRTTFENFSSYWTLLAGV